MSTLYLIVKLGRELVAFPALSIESVIDLESVTPVPQAPAHVLGISALRSRPLTVIDANRALALPEDHAAEPVRHAVVVAIEGHLYALAVTEVRDVVEATADPEAVPTDLGPQWGRAGRGMIETAHGAMLVMDLQELVAGPAERHAA